MVSHMLSRIRIRRTQSDPFLSLNLKDPSREFDCPRQKRLAERMSSITFAPVENYLAYSRGLARELSLVASARGASSSDASKIEFIAARALPILLFELHGGEVETTPSAFISCLRLACLGISTSALQRRDIPMVLRDALLPALRPDTFETHIKWWDCVALPNWVGPFFMELGDSGAFHAIVSVAAVESAIKVEAGD